MLLLVAVGSDAARRLQQDTPNPLSAVAGLLGGGSSGGPAVSAQGISDALVKVLNSAVSSSL